MARDHLLLAALISACGNAPAAPYISTSDRDKVLVQLRGDERAYGHLIVTVPDKAGFADLARRAAVARRTELRACASGDPSVVVIAKLVPGAASVTAVRSEAGSTTSSAAPEIAACAQKHLGAEQFRDLDPALLDAFGFVLVAFRPHLIPDTVDGQAWKRYR